MPEPFEKNRLEARKSSLVEEKTQQYELFETGLLTKEARIRHKLIGQVFETYWIVEYDGKLFIIDQHAAHEKVLSEKLMKRFKESQPMFYRQGNGDRAFGRFVGRIAADTDGYDRRQDCYDGL